MTRVGLLPVLLLVCLIAAPASLAAAQSRPASLGGVVVDQTGAAIAGAPVTVRRPSAGFERRLQTGGQGTFQIDGLPAGEYEVTATGTGLTVGVQRVALASGEVRRLRFELHVGALNEDVVVLGTEVAGTHERLRRMPGSVDIVDREALEQSRVLTTNEALRKVAGVHVRDEEGLGLRPNIGFRGINPTRSNKVLLLEDGIPLTYAPYGDNASYYHPPVDRFARIEVLKGGAQIAYGPQTVSGLVNYITPAPPVKSSGSVTLVGGNRDYFNGHLNYGNTIGRSGFLIDYMRKQGDGSRDNVRANLNDVNAKLVRTAGSRQTWTFRGNYYSEDSNITYSGAREDEYRLNPRGNPFRNDFFYIDRHAASASHAVAVNGDVALTTNAYVASFRRHWWRQSSNSAQRPNDAADPACGGMTNLNTTCGNEGRLRQYYTWGVEPRLRVHYQVFGVRSEADLGVRLHVEEQDRQQRNGPTPTSRDGVLEEDNLRRTHAYSAFLLNRLLFAGWTITPGIRVERIESDRTNRRTGATGDSALTQIVPGIGLSHTLGDRVTLFAGVHRGFAPPRTEDVITNTGGVVDLDPELSWNSELGVRSTLGPGLVLDATVFRMDYENQIVAASLAGGVGATLTNAGSTLHQGVEVTSRFDSAAAFHSAHNLFVRAAYTYVPAARFTGVRFSGVSGFGNVRITGNRLPYSPEQLITIGVGYAHPSGVDTLLEAVHTSQQFGDDLNTVAPAPDGQRGLLPGYTAWNAAVNYRVARATVFVTVKNLLDDLFIVDRTRGILPGSPRLVQAGVKVVF